MTGRGQLYIGFSVEAVTMLSHKRCMEGEIPQLPPVMGSGDSGTHHRPLRFTCGKSTSDIGTERLQREHEGRRDRTTSLRCRPVRFIHRMSP